jgi:hypothetical protein
MPPWASGLGNRETPPGLSPGLLLPWSSTLTSFPAFADLLILRLFSGFRARRLHAKSKRGACRMDKPAKPIWPRAVNRRIIGSYPAGVGVDKSAGNSRAWGDKLMRELRGKRTVVSVWHPALGVPLPVA